MHGNHPASLQIRTEVFHGVSGEWINRFCFYFEVSDLKKNKYAKLLRLLSQHTISLFNAVPTQSPKRERNTLGNLHNPDAIFSLFFVSFFALSVRVFTFTCGFCFLHVHNSHFVPEMCVCVCVCPGVSQGNELYISAKPTFLRCSDDLYINFSIHRKVFPNSNKF